MTQTQSKELLEAIKEDLKQLLSKHRYKHTESVVVTAIKYAEIFELNEEDKKKIEIAAWSHDICKEFKNQELLDLAKYYGIEVHPEDKACPNLLHARVGAAYLEDKYDLYDPDILHPIRDHTLGHKQMSLLSKILYLADMLEPSRDQGLDEHTLAEFNNMREIIVQGKDINEALLIAMNSKISYVISRNHPIHHLGVEARNALLKQ